MDYRERPSPASTRPAREFNHNIRSHPVPRRFPDDIPDNFVAPQDEDFSSGRSTGNYDFVWTRVVRHTSPRTETYRHSMIQELSRMESSLEHFGLRRGQKCFRASPTYIFNEYENGGNGGGGELGFSIFGQSAI